MEKNHHNLAQISNPEDGGHGHDEAVRDFQIRREMPNEESLKSLYEASETGSTQNLKALIQKDPDIIQKVLVCSCDTESPLHISILQGHLEFTQFLLDQKSELIGEVDILQRTPLHLASANGDIEIVHLLLEKNTGPCLVRDLNGLIPLHYALIRGQIEIMQVLINARPQSMRIKLGNGQTVLHLCVIHSHLEVIKFLIGLVIQEEEFLNTTDNSGNSILDLALMLRQIEFVRYFLSIPVLKPAGTRTMDTSASDVIKECPRLSNNFEIQETENENEQRGSQQCESLSPIPAKKTSCWKSVKKHLRYRGDWLQEVQGTLMLVATMIATMTFQGAINPPGGVSQQDPLIHSNMSMAILASQGSIWYIRFLFVNTTSFLASMNVILLIISGFPLRNRICASLLTLVMCVAIVFLAFSFLIGMQMVNLAQPIHFTFLKIRSIIFCCIVVLVCLGCIIRFLIWVAKLLIRALKMILRTFTTKIPAASSTTT